MREKIKLVSSAKTGHYYTTTKNKKEHPDKMETRSLILKSGSMSSTKKQKSNNTLLQHNLKMPELPEVEVTKKALESALKKPRSLG